MTKAATRLQIYPDPKYSAFEVEARDPDGRDQQRFAEVSAELTGFSIAELHATGNVGHLYEELGTVVGVPVRREFVRTRLSPEARMADAFHGPLARNVVRIWYLGHWQRLPDSWVGKLPAAFKPFDEFGRNFNRMISARAYREALAWPAIGANPPAAKQPGFASWAEPPR